MNEIREQIEVANNFAGRSLTPPEHDAWKDIKASMEKLLAVYEAAIREEPEYKRSITLKRAIDAVQTSNKRENRHDKRTVEKD